MIKSNRQFAMFACGMFGAAFSAVLLILTVDWQRLEMMLSLSGLR
jgi:hypothetical protein